MTENTEAMRAGMSAGVPAGILSTDAGIDPPPFTPKHLAWIDQLIVSRQGQRPVERDAALQSVSGDPLPTTASSLGETRVHVQKILRGDFVDMHELLPETWWAEEPKESCCRSSRPKRDLVIDISLWSECYASLVQYSEQSIPTRHPTSCAISVPL